MKKTESVVIAGIALVVSLAVLASASPIMTNCVRIDGEGACIKPPVPPAPVNPPPPPPPPVPGFFGVFNHAIAYRGNPGHPAIANFAFPNPIAVQHALISVVAYNDDPYYTRAVWLEIDGKGGYLGTRGVGPMDVSGGGVLMPKSYGQWTYDLAAVKVGYTLGQGMGPGRDIPFLEILKKPGTHKIAMWVSTYKQFGPESFVTVNIMAPTQPLKPVPAIRANRVGGGMVGAKPL